MEVIKCLMKERNGKGCALGTKERRVIYRTSHRMEAQGIRSGSYEYMINVLSILYTPGIFECLTALGRLNYVTQGPRPFDRLLD